MFHLFKRPTTGTMMRRWAGDAESSALDHRHEAVSLRAQAELSLAKAKGADAIAEMYEERARVYRREAGEADSRELDVGGAALAEAV